jgi:hypothetical protein
MTKTDDLLEKLEKNLSDYIKTVGKFQHENNTFALVGHYHSDVYLNCEVCGHERINDIYVIMDESGKKWNVGNVCIEKLTNMKIKEWFESWQRKKDMFTKNRIAINYLDWLLDAYENEELPIEISKIGIQRLTAMFERMYNGLDPLKTQWKLYYYYKNKIDAEE